MGNTVNLYAHEFLITWADEPTMRFMERHRDKFPHSYIRVRGGRPTAGFGTFNRRWTPHLTFLLLGAL